MCKGSGVVPTSRRHKAGRTNWRCLRNVEIQWPTFSTMNNLIRTHSTSFPGDPFPRLHRVYSFPERVRQLCHPHPRERGYLIRRQWPWNHIINHLLCFETEWKLWRGKCQVPSPLASIWLRTLCLDGIGCPLPTRELISEFIFVERDLRDTTDNIWLIFWLEYPSVSNKWAQCHRQGLIGRKSGQMSGIKDW